MKTSEFENALSKFSYGVYVLTASMNEKINGCTIAWVSRVSFEPPIVAVSIAPERLTHGYVKQAKTFALSVIPDSDRGVELGRHFGLVSGRKVDKFANIGYFTGETGAPILKEAIGYVECKVIFSTEAGDHTIFVGEILSGKVLDESEKPLTFIPSQYFGL
ncbi:MAG: flavin reductase [Deltaproteobacteria bacterium]|nr:flavin reductase [Deltaproteobacteria bacterium]